MHLNKILEQIKRHQSPSEAIDKLSTALEKHEGSLLEKGFTILKSELAANMYEAINGPHFDEEHARYAVEGMENEDGTKGPHWTVEETTSVANQMGLVCCHEYDLFRLLQSSRCYDWQRKYQTLRRIGKSLAM